MTEQWPLADHRGFTWYFDVAVWLEGSNRHRGHTELIEIQGPTHSKQRKYSGPGGGYTRDSDKEWELWSVQGLHKRGYDLTKLTTEECKKVNAPGTAARIVEALIRRADSG